MTPARFELLQIEDGPPAVRELRGEIDATNAADFGDALRAETASGPVILDLSRAAYFDSAGFQVLDGLLATRSLSVIISATSVLGRAASLMGVRFHATLDQAMGALRSSP